MSAVPRSWRRMVYGGAAAAFLIAAAAHYMYSPAASVSGGVLEVVDPDNVLGGAMVTLAPLTVNLGEPDSFLRVSLEMELFDFYPPSDLAQYLPRVRDAFVSSLSAKKPEELLTLAGKDELKTELLEAANEVLPSDNQAVRIYLTEFTVQ